MNYGIIAAGEGSRLVQEKIMLPKPLVSINGEPMIGRLIRIFQENDATSISIIINEEMEAVRTYLENLELAVPLNLVVQSTPSSMHSFYGLKPFLESDRFCLTTVDTMFREDEFAAYIRSFRQDEHISGMMAVTGYVDDEKPLYIETDDKLVIKGFYDHDFPERRYISGGIYGLAPVAFDILESCMNAGISRMRNFQRALISGGLTLKAYPFSKIIDVDHAADIAKAEQFVK